MTLREAVKEALEGRQKQTALDLWPERRDAEAELSKVLAGERRPPWELLELVLQVPSRAPVLRFVERLAHVECRPLARPVAHELGLIREALDGLRAHAGELQERLEWALDCETQETPTQEESGPGRAPMMRARPTERRRRAG